MPSYDAATSKFTVPNAIAQRWQIDNLLENSDRPEIAGLDVIQGLSQNPKSLPPKYFYDDKGSLLFEEICELPEYYPTRTEAAILASCTDEMIEIIDSCELVELGSGSSSKTRLILDGIARAKLPLRYLPIDVSAGILETSARKLVADYPDLEVHGLVGTYELALKHLIPKKLPQRLIIFLGSTLGNLNPQECEVFFDIVKNGMEKGDYFLLGIDLQKPKHILEAAYNDSQGVTAAFNLNMLDHLNWRFRGNFDPNLFAHVAIYNETENQIEMYLQSESDRTFKLESLNLQVNFAKDEMMLTEISRKFELQSLQKQLQSHGLTTLKTWTDSNNWFGVMLCQWRGVRD
jgi:L-histidine Nalpha-methyltransferase